jgi:hypothetical protein
MKIKYLPILTLFFLTLPSCIKEKFSDDKFVTSKTEYTANQLRIDGYYQSKSEKEDYYYLCVFYRNGIVLLPGVAYEPNSYIAKLVDNFNHEIKTFWGLFIIENGKITIEYYKPKMIEGLPAYLRTGEIINDTTFILKEEKRSKDDTEFKIISETYLFKQFSPKPDSTNKFLK